MKTRNPNKFSASYTTLSYWAAGDTDRAIRSYFHIPWEMPPSLQAALRAGQTYHDMWLQETRQTKCLPGIFGGTKLDGVVVLEDRVLVGVDDWMDLVIKPDLIEGRKIRDYKTGNSTAQSEVNKYQLGVYAVGMAYLSTPVEMGIVHHYNQYTREVGSAYRWITDKYLEDSENWIRNNAWDMHNYLINNDIYGMAERGELNGN